MSRIRALLAALALVAGLLAGFIGSASPPLADDEILALDLARWIVSHRPGLQLIDLRGPAEFDQDHLPGAIPLTAWANSALVDDRTLVVYSARSTERDALAGIVAHPDQQPVLRLHGGFEAWSGQVLFPTMRSNAPASERRAFDEQSRLSRYFGGTPRVLAPGTSSGLQRSRRGC